MTFETGLAANEFELQEKLNAFILSTDGWRKISQASEFESVYYSAGEDGYKDIYVKTRAGVTDIPTPAGGQKDFGDGYSGYLNFFVYQFYPEGGDGYDGYGEAGKFGPYFAYGATSSETMYLQRVSVQSSSNRKWGTAGGTGGMRTMLYGEDLPTGYSISDPFSEHSLVFDGGQYVYFYGAAGYFAYDLGNEGSKILSPYLSIGRSNDYGDLVYSVDAKTRKGYFWDSASTNDYTDNVGSFMNPFFRAWGFRRWNIGSELTECGFNLPTWQEQAGSNYYSKYSRLIWDGHNHLYMIRGENRDDDTKEWAKYHIPTATWTILSPEFPIARPKNFVWLDKRVSGFQYHRIYILTTSGIYYINIDENSGITVGSWVYASANPDSVYDESQIFHNNRNRWYYFVYPSATTNSREMYMAEMTPGTLSWSLVDSNYWPADASGDTAIMHLDGYTSRVRTSIKDATEYWFFGSRDHITVMTQADGESSYCYMGAIDSLAVTPISPHGTTTSRVYAGTSVEIPMSTQKGEFIIGNKMMIADVVDGGGGEQIGDVEGIARKFMPAEQFTIIHVNPGVSITADEIKQNYSAGSKVAYDPQPVGITLGNMNKIQMLNHINTIDDAASFDMAENIAYMVTVNNEIVNASGNDDRRNGIILWPVMVSKSGYTASFSGAEVRGVLRGMYAVSGTAGFSDGDTIVVGDNVFKIFDTNNAKGYMYAFGPIE